MEAFPKFIIEDIENKGICLIIGRCTYHHQMVQNKEKVKSGGWWRLNTETNTYIFSGDSHDFGKASLEDIKKCIESGNVFKNRRMNDSIVSQYNFAYDMQYEIVKISV